MTNEFKLSQKHKNLILAVIGLIAFTAILGTVAWRAGRIELCDSLNGTYLKNEQCIQDKCISDFAVCKDAMTDSFIFVNLSEPWTTNK